MSRTLPPLNALRAFEATARLTSIAAAALELNVTPGAVSRQIKVLEEWLGQQLFIRQHRQLTATTFAAEYVVSISRALDIIDDATKPAIAKNSALTICCYPTFTQRWLIPRWKQFIERHPTKSLHILTSMNPFDSLGKDYDACICIGTDTTKWGDWTAVRLSDIVTIPVCSPGLINRNKGPIKLSTLGEQTLLRCASRPLDWPRWLDAAGAEPVDCEKGPLFENQAFAIDAAIEGVGIFIADRALVCDDIDNGRLVQPFGPERFTNHSFYFVYSKKHTPKQRVDPIIHWLQDQA